MTQKKYPVTVEGFDGSFQELAHRIGKMRYDKVAEFLSYLASEFQQQSVGDMNRERLKLSALLCTASQQTKELQEQLEQIWLLCEPHMMHE